MYVPIKYTNSQYVQFALYTIQNIMQFNIETMCWTDKKGIQWNILEIFHGTFICQLFLKIKYIPILRNVPAVCLMFQ